MSEVETLLERLEATYMDGFADEVTGDVESPVGHAYRVARSVVRTDNFGFKYDEHFPTEADARDYFAAIEAEYGAWVDEDDYFFGGP